MPADSLFEAATVGHVIMSECAAAVEECIGGYPIGAAGDADLAMQADARQTLDKAEVDLLQCGYDRRTLIVVPSSKKSQQTVDALAKVRPTATVVFADVDEPVVFCEGSGVNPSSLARGFERVYPGIAEAASRMFTRIDIDWSAGTL
jgi:hypothetical protein